MDPSQKFLEEAKMLEARWKTLPGYKTLITPAMLEASRLPNELSWPPFNMLCPECGTPLEDLVYEYQCPPCRNKGPNAGRYRKDDPMTYIVKCLLCEKDLECDKHFIYDGGPMLISFGYGSRHDQGGISINDTTNPVNYMLSSMEIEAYICDDCFEKKMHLMRGFNVVEKRERVPLKRFENS